MPQTDDVIALKAKQGAEVRRADHDRLPLPRQQANHHDRALWVAGAYNNAVTSTRRDRVQHWD